MTSGKLRTTLMMPFGVERHSDSSCPEPGDRTTQPGEARVPDDELPRAGDIVGDLYRLVRRLGEGMFGQVYEAERTDVPEHRVALKLMSRDVYAGRNVERELVMLAAASHPHIVQLKDHGMTDHYVWLSMPLYEGETLAERLERGTLTLREAYDIFVPIARGLQSLHERGLRHQDVKPENIYLARFANRLHPVLLDLGVAVEKSAEFVAGTALFAAPEQLAALAGMAPGHQLDERIDSYCLASTLLYAIVGEPHYPGSDALTPFAVANAFEERETSPLREGALPSLTGAPRAELHRAMKRWLVRDPSARPSAGTMADELDVLLAQEREAEQAIERGIAAQKSSLRRVRFALVSLALVAAGAGAFGYSKRQTLRLASELERARAQGATTFDQLDTCVAAHQLSQKRAQDCSDDRTRLESSHRQALSALEADSDAVERELNRRLGAAKRQTRACEEDHEVASREWDEERSSLTTALADEKTRHTELESALASTTQKAKDLEKELERQSQARKACESASASASESRDECREDLASCIQDRDTCTAEPDVAQQPPRSPLAPATTPPAPTPAKPTGGGAGEGKSAPSAPQP